MWSHSVFRDSGLAQLIVGPAGRISVANPAATTLVGTSSLAGANLADLIAAPDRGSVDAFLATLAELPAGRSQALGPVQLVGPGRSRTVQMIGARTRGEGGFDALVIAVHEVPAAEAGAVGPELLVDPLTGVGTRARGLEALRRATRPGAPGCVLVVDLDGFGWINESLGTVEGDRILAEVAERLLHAVPPGATVARIDGDQFLVVSSSTPMVAAPDLAGVAFSALAKPMHIAGTRVVTVSIGVAGLGGSDVDEVLGRALSALTVAKEQGGQQIVIDGPTLQDVRATSWRCGRDHPGAGHGRPTRMGAGRPGPGRGRAGPGGGGAGPGRGRAGPTGGAHLPDDRAAQLPGLPRGGRGAAG